MKRTVLSVVLFLLAFGTAVHVRAQGADPEGEACIPGRASAIFGIILRENVPLPTETIGHEESWHRLRGSTRWKTVRDVAKDLRIRALDSATVVGGFVSMSNASHVLAKEFPGESRVLIAAVREPSDTRLAASFVRGGVVADSLLMTRLQANETVVLRANEQEPSLLWVVKMIPVQPDAKTKGPSKKFLSDKKSFMASIRESSGRRGQVYSNVALTPDEEKQLIAALQRSPRP